MSFNLKKVLKGILDFYADVLGQHIRDFHMPDLSVIAERGDVVETGRLLQLVLGCAVNCDKKQHYIEEIMGMEEAVQHVVMNAIQVTRLIVISIIFHYRRHTWGPDPGHHSPTAAAVSLTIIPPYYSLSLE